MSTPRAWPGSIALVLVSAALANPPGLPPADDRAYVTPPSLEASFDPLPEMWGLHTLAPDVRLDALDTSFVFYVRDRARFRSGGAAGRVYLERGRQLIAPDGLSADAVAAHVAASSCVCAIDFETTDSSRDIHVAAGAYRLSQPPSVATDASGTTTAEFVFAPSGQSDRITLRRLTCWTTEPTLKTVQTALPAFASMTRKRHAGFIDPPIDDRHVLRDEVEREARAAGPGAADGTLLLWSNGTPRQGTEQVFLGSDRVPPVPVRPGLFALIDSMSGAPQEIDNSGYFLDLPTLDHALDRSQGVFFRNPLFWP